MKKFIIAGLILTCILTTHAQKPAFDTSMRELFDHWPLVGQGQLSHDGAYVLYAMENIPAAGEQTIVVRSTTGDWKREWVHASRANFTSDSRELLLQGPGDSLCIIKLKETEETVIPRVKEYKLFEGLAGQQWLAYRRTDTPGLLVLRQWNTGREERLADVESYQPNAQRTALLLQRRVKTDSAAGSLLLQWKELKEGGLTRNIWEGENASQFVFDKQGTQLAFEVVSKQGTQPSRSLWHYRASEEHAKVAADETCPGVGSDQEILGDEPSFSADGKRIFIRLRHKPIPSVMDQGVPVDVWHYRDVVIRSDQAGDNRLPQDYLAVVRIGEQTVIPLQQEGETLVTDPSGHSDHGLAYTLRSGLESWWNWSATNPSPVYSVSLRDGSRKVIQERGSYRLHPSRTEFSPDDKWILYFDRAAKRWKSYEMATGALRTIAQDIPYPLYKEYNSEYASAAPFNSRLIGVGVGGWWEGGRSVLIYDDYDLWKVDPAGLQRSVNLTQGYGRRHRVKLRLATESGQGRVTILHPGDTLLLAGFEPETKRNGFYRLVSGNGAPPMLLSTGDYVMYCSESQLIGQSPSREGSLLKARDAQVWLVTRRSATDARNYFTTHDFKSFNRVSDLQPQRTYNWLTTELVHWQMTDGNTGTGILYKPENLDMRKKYPVIFYYYEQYSDDLNDFPQPELTCGPINIPYFVSRGYLVFVPDIHYQIGNSGQAAVIAVETAARYLKQHYAFVDGQHMGLHGHSFGGYETNYIVTHTQLFAAASEAAGMSDCVSNYGELVYGSGRGKGESNQQHYEAGQGRIGGSLWSNTAGYIANSPIFRADRITTPLLMMHNIKDGIVPFSQATELFTALRRMGKRAWLLQYDEGSHIVGAQNAVLDYTIRLSQFFDHYLKGVGAPLWMTEGVPAKDKGRRTGYEMDTSGKKP